jgi:hypothetical protein|tara:strand:- start:262 stop:402 length:141 start_codon:yes stop_codon:yes gene_type:complete
LAVARAALRSGAPTGANEIGACDAAAELEEEEEELELLELLDDAIL